MKTQIEIMNEARLKNCLNTRLNFGTEILTIAEAINTGKFTRAGSFDEPKVRYNRIKFNRMDGEQQKIYEAKMKEMKTVYALYLHDNTFFDVQKLVHDYFLTLIKQH